MTDLITYSLLIAVVCIVIKIIFWYRIPGKKFRLLYKSFIRHYSVYDMHDAPSKQILTFWNASNWINYFLWLATACIIVALFLQINPLQLSAT